MHSWASRTISASVTKEVKWWCGHVYGFSRTLAALFWIYCSLWMFSPGTSMKSLLNLSPFKTRQSQTMELCLQCYERYPLNITVKNLKHGCYPMVADVTGHMAQPQWWLSGDSLDTPLSRINTFCLSLLHYVEKSDTNSKTDAHKYFTSLSHFPF